MMIGWRAHVALAACSVLGLFAWAPSCAAASDTPPDGAAIATRGIWSKKVPACESCHGPGARGVGDAFPALAGMPADVVSDILTDFQEGARKSHPQSTMPAIAARLDGPEIDAVGTYLAGLPTKPPPAKAPVAPKGESFDDVVARGEAIFRDPAALAAPYVGNTLTCQNCHLDAGHLAGASPLGPAFVAYPAFRTKDRKVITFSERLQGCFRYSMNGRAPPLGDDTLVALEAYSYALAKGLKVEADAPGRGYAKLTAPETFDIARGAEVYKQRCTLCHGSDGAGQKADGRQVFPALWGPDSYNWGAGMGSIANAAAFIKANMPLAVGGTLSDADAWDVAAFVDSHERPQDPRFTGDVAEARKRFHDSRFWLYGTRVGGVLLGESSPPSGPRTR